MVLSIVSDPSLRLGAWENPPKDIMNAPFFRHIEWDAVYERRQDGPYMPELPSFMTNKRRNTTDFVLEREISVAIPESWKKLEFAPVPIERMTIVDPEKERAEAEAKKEKASRKRDDEGEEEDSDDSMEESEGSDEGEIAMRDSVFVTSDVNNQLADWSFIDEAVLMSYVTAAAEGKTAGKKKKSKKKDSSSSAAVVDEVDLLKKETKMETIAEEVAVEEDAAAQSTVSAEHPVPAVPLPVLEEQHEAENTTL